MESSNYLIGSGMLKKDALSGKTVLLTGGGGEIGFETARSLLWLGARVILAEIDCVKGKLAEKLLTEEFGAGRAFFERVDIGSQKSVKKLAKRVDKRYGVPDVLFHNATIAPIGAVHTVGTRNWDRSYCVNLKGPVMLVEAFLPQMLERKSGAVVFVPSSGAAPYMGAYEVFKTAQVELCNTLAGELEGTGVFTYSIGPGIVKTGTANKAIEQIAPLYGKTVEEFYQMNQGALITAEEAGAGFAASVALAEQYHGMETSSMQALMDVGIAMKEQQNVESFQLMDEDKKILAESFAKVLTTFKEQADGWQKRVVFERQWVLRDFKKQTGLSPEQMMVELKLLKETIDDGKLPVIEDTEKTVRKIVLYYNHQMDLLKGYEKNPQKREENVRIIQDWIDEAECFLNSCRLAEANLQSMKR